MKDIFYTIHIDVRVPNHYNPNHIPNLIQAHLEKEIPLHKPIVRATTAQVS
jgi:hypothetical protein